MVTDWRHTTGFIPCKFHSGPGHEPWPPSIWQKVQENTDTVRQLSYSSLNSGLLNRTSSQICGSWYLSVFLFRDGSFTLMNVVSFIVLVRFCGYLPTMLTLSTLESWPLMLKCSQMFLKPFLKSSCRFTNVLLIKLYPVLPIPIYHSTFLWHYVFILGGPPVHS